MFCLTTSPKEAPEALTRLALFSTDKTVRQAAIKALHKQDSGPATALLLKGLRYPWPSFAQNSAEAVVQLKRVDLLAELVKMLDEPDPRAPTASEVKGKKVQTVRELVRINHHRNCLLCHAPANTGNVAQDTLTAAVPIPQDPLPSPSQGYQNSVPDILVRLDVTYLRQDFSMLQAVADANPWPEMQRFDFLVRNRTLTDKEVDKAHKKIEDRLKHVLKAQVRGKE